MSLHPNDGARPSRLELARMLTGERDAPPDAAPALAELRALADAAPVPVFDAARLRAAAEALPQSLGTPRPRLPAANRGWALLAGLVTLAAALLLFVLPAQTRHNRAKGDDDLGFYLLRAGQVYAGDPDALVRAGDRLQFTYRSVHDSRLILLSVDGTGSASVYYPATGDDGIEIIPGERHVLDGSIELDDAPGPEVFVGFFGDAWTVDDARAEAEDAWAEDGDAGLRALADTYGDVAVLVLEKE